MPPRSGPLVVEVAAPLVVGSIPTRGANKTITYVRLFDLFRGRFFHNRETSTRPPRLGCALPTEHLPSPNLWREAPDADSTPESTACQARQPSKKDAIASMFD
jgi:hypothetical protein